MSKHNLRWVVGAILSMMVALALGLVVAPANAAAPGAVQTCSAVDNGNGTYSLDWSDVVATPTVNWYTIRMEGAKTSSDPEMQVSGLPPVSEATWTQPISSDTFVIRAHNPDGVGAWCSAPIEDGGTTPPPNEPPGVNAGPDQTVALSGTANLDGTITKQDSETVTQQWTKDSGPGTVSFGTPTNVDTTATFSAAGTYVLRLSATDNGGASAFDTVSVTVTDDTPPPGNQPPSVNAGADQTITLPATASLDGTTSDPDGDNVTENWSKVSGPGTITWTCRQCQDATAAFSTDGVYVLRLTGNDGTVSVSDDVTVTVLPEDTTEPPPTGGVNPDVGIRVFPHYSGATYGNHEAVLDDLGRLGVDRVSGLLTANMSSDEITFYRNAYSRHGIKFWAAVGAPGDVYTDADWAKVRDILSDPAKLKGIVEVASGWNEPNHRVSNFVAPTAAHQSKLWTNVQQVNAATGQNIKVGTPPLWSGNINTQFNDMRALAPHIQGKYNLINWHMYPHGNTGSALQDMIDRQISEYRSAYGNFPMLNSESGYSTSVNSSNGNPVTEAQQAALIDDLILFHTQRNVDISYFEFLNDPDASLSNREAHFGLIYTPSTDPSTWRDKPAFAVFAGLVD